jgi:putative transposase
MKRLYGELRRELVEQFRKLCLQKGCQIVEGHMMLDHVHMLISIPPKYSVSHVVGFLKGKTALYVANKYARKRKYRGYHFWARGYFVSTTGYNEQVVRCVVPDCDGASLILSRQEEDALWEVFFTAAPARRRVFEPNSKRRKKAPGPLPSATA